MQVKIFSLKSSRYLAGGVLFIYSTMVTAQSPDDHTQLTEQDYFADIPMVLSATRLPQSKREAPVAITVIDREMIEASGYTEIPDLLRLVPGFLVDYDSGHIQAAFNDFPCPSIQSLVNHG